jgi:hypothetical protein
MKIIENASILYSWWHYSDTILLYGEERLRYTCLDMGVQQSL